MLFPPRVPLNALEVGVGLNGVRGSTHLSSNYAVHAKGVAVVVERRYKATARIPKHGGYRS